MSKHFLDFAFKPGLRGIKCLTLEKFTVNVRFRCTVRNGAEAQIKSFPLRTLLEFSSFLRLMQRLAQQNDSR